MDRRYISYWVLAFILVLAFSCSKKEDVPQNTSSDVINNPSDTTNTSDSTGSSSSNPPDSSASQPTSGEMPKEVMSDINILQYGTKISQLVGDYDLERKEATQNRTFSTYQLKETDLGAPFRFRDRTYILFGDTHGGVPGNRDAISYTTDTNPDDGLSLIFLHDNNNVWLPVTIPSVSLGAFEVPMEGVEVDHKMYIYATTNHSAAKTMGKSVLARSYDDGHTFKFIYSLSSMYFINVSIVKTQAEEWSMLPQDMEGDVLMMFGSGNYRESDVYLACQPAKSIEDQSSIRYFAGLDDSGKPIWSKKEEYSIPLFDQPQVGELSVTYNAFIKRWVMLYNAADPRGINIRTADFPWGSWTKPQVIFDPSKDGGYCHFMHTSWAVQKCDSVMDPEKENIWGGEYGPYQYPYFAKGDSLANNPYTTIYFNMSTWNPYTVVLMKAKLQRQ